MERQHSWRLTRWQNAYSPNNIVLESLLACKREGIARVPPFSRNNCLHEILSLLLIRNNNYTQRNSYIHLTDFSTKECFEIESIVSYLSFFFFFSRSTKIFQLSSMSSNRFTGIGYLRGPWPTPRWRRERLWRTSSNPSRILSDHPATLLSTIVNGSVNGNSD